MTDLVERVARALCGEDDIVGDWRAYVDQARAAIAAMREPTSKMLKAACASMSEEKRPTPEYIPVKGKHRVRWQAMIDEALK